MKRSKSSHNWLKNHEEDEYVRRAREEGYRSRASYKLLEMQEKFQLIRPGDTVVDLGAAPGGWSQVALREVGDGRVIALDLLDMNPIPGVEFMMGDFTESQPLEALLRTIGEKGVDLVISDMAPNLSGVKEVDQPRAAYLVELALELVERVLKPGGKIVAKAFEGEGIQQLRDEFRRHFRQVSNYKPRASRSKSREIYLIGRDFKG